MLLSLLFSLLFTSDVFFVVLVTEKNDLNGDELIISNIIEVSQENKREEIFYLLSNFEDQIQKQYPKNVIHVNISCVLIFDTVEEAEKEIKKMKVENDHKNVGVNL